MTNNSKDKVMLNTRVVGNFHANVPTAEWLACLPSSPEVPGSSPPPPNINFYFIFLICGYTILPPLPSPPLPTHQVGVAHTKSGKNHFSSKIGHKMAPPGFFKIFLNKGIPGYGNAIVTFRSQMSSLVLNSFLSKATLRQRFPIRLSGNSTPLMD